MASLLTDDEINLLVTTCDTVWKHDKFKVVRSYEKLFRNICVKFQKNLISRSSKDSAQLKFQDNENVIKSIINNYFIQKLDKKFSRGIQSLINIQEDVGFAITFLCEEKFFKENFGDGEIQVESDVLQLNESLPEINTDKYNEIKNIISESMKTSQKHITQLRRSFDLDRHSKKLVNFYIKYLVKETALKTKRNFPKKSEFYNTYKSEFEIQDSDNKHEIFFKKIASKNPYFEFNFTDFFFTLLRLINFFTGLKIKLEPDIDRKIFLKFFCPKEKYLGGYAEYFEYEMQLKNYALKYDSYNSEIVLGSKQSDQENSSLLVKKENISLQFEDLDENNQTHFPPYACYEEKKKIKFRKYTINDLHHDDLYDPEFTKKGLAQAEIYDEVSEYSIYRNIDKVRLIFQAFDTIIKISKLKSYGYIKESLFLRNFNAYKEDLEPKNLLWGSANIFDLKTQNKFVSKVRNFYGEKIAFYFLWISRYIIWLVFPALIGLIVFICDTLNDNKIFFMRGVDSKGNPDAIGPIDIVYFTFSIFMVIWASLFIKVWKQTEKKYSHFWGVENFEETEPFDDAFIRDYKHVYIFGYKIPYQSQVKKVFRYIFSYFIVGVFIVIVLSSLAFLFWLKDQYLAEENIPSRKNDSFYEKKSFYIEIATALQVIVYSFIYQYIVEWLTDWENHEKESKYDRSLSIKTVIFEFVNNYSALYYIAFIRTNIVKAKCDGDCWSELRSQLYTQLIIIFLFNAIELGVPFILSHFSKKNFQKTYPNKEIDFSPHTIYHQITAVEYSSVRDDYNEILIMFGYLVFFSIMAPLSPLILTVLTFAERLVDIYKIFYLSRVTINSEANGIGIYNLLFKIWLFIGLTTNLALILFTNPSFQKTSLIVKFAIFIVIENIFIVIAVSINFNVLPKWFEYKSLNAILYDRRYYDKDSTSLPHYELKKKVIKASNPN